MNIRPIRTVADYRRALRAVSALVDLDPRPTSPEGELLDVLSTLVEAWERKHYPIEAPDAVEAIKFRMEQQGLTPRDLQPMIGGLNRVYEVLARRRPLTMAMVRRLHEQLGIPADSLIRSTAPERAAA
jgi:HTH-type transcriptional regulator/antitoxin HigA